ncbi:MAG TPA: ABC transporter substrate-binding protein [Gemmatimonadaceae bacterium]|jgi:iron complex transport system substrate-binding protein|nr:ABC transporter substrate-binding protein [Gemmatimonadaceae bacterium]
MRVVTLLPSATEIVAALGALDSIVGVTHECDFPAQVESRMRVTSSLVNSADAPGAVDAGVRTLVAEGTSLYALDEPGIRSLQPDFIFTQALCDVCAVMETDVRALATRLSPEPRVISLSATTLDGVFDDIATVARTLSLKSEGDGLLAGLRSRMLHVHETLKAARAPRPRVAMIEWTDPIFAGGHWVPEMIRRAGGSDVLASTGEHSKVATFESIAAAGPEIVLVAPCGYGVGRATEAARKLVASPMWNLPASTAVWALDGNSLTSRPGPRLVDGIEVMARIFNPSLFTPVDGSCAVRVS